MSGCVGMGPSALLCLWSMVLPTTVLHSFDVDEVLFELLFWFNLNIVELIHTLTSDKQVSRRLDIFFQLSSGLITRYIFVHLSVIGITLMTKIMASANFTDWFCKNTVQSVFKQ
jgi:hypothetical protein